MERARTPGVFLHAGANSSQGGMKMRVVDRSDWKKYLVCCLVTAALLAALPNVSAGEPDGAWRALDRGSAGSARG